MLKLIKAIIRFFNFKAEAAAGTVDKYVEITKQRVQKILDDTL